MDLFLKGKWTPTSITAGITPKGSFSVLVAIENNDPTAEFGYEIVSLNRSLQLPENAQSVTEAIIPTPRPVATVNDLLSPTPAIVETPFLAKVGDSPSQEKYKNVLGIVLVGGILVLLASVFFPRKREKRTPTRNQNERTNPRENHNK